MEGDIIQMQEIFKYQREGYDADGKIMGSFRATGVRPKLLTDLKAHGFDIPASYFDPSVVL
jgi:pilus assembly protein CpaF